MNSLSRGSYLLSSLAVIACLANVVEILPAFAKTWSIDERQLQMMQDINQGQKLKRLTDKEAKKLREQLSNIARKKKKFQKGDTTSQAFSDAQKAELGTDLDKVRDDIKKVETAKLEPKDSSKVLAKETSKEASKKAKSDPKKDLKTGPKAETKREPKIDSKKLQK